MNKRTYILLGLLAVLSAGLLVREYVTPKSGTAELVSVETTPAPPIAGFTITRADPEALVPVIRANMAGTPSAVRLSEIAREFAAAEGLTLQQLSLQAPNPTSVVADIPLSADAKLVIDKVNANGQTRLWLHVRDKAMGEVPALRPVFDRLVAKVRDAFPDNAIEEVD